MRLPYQEPPEWEIDDIVGRANLNIFVDNDQLFFGLARRQELLHRGAVHSSVTNTNLVIYDAYHLLEADATDLKYKFGGVKNDTPNCTFTMYYDYGGDNQTTIATVTATSTITPAYATGAYPLVGYTPGLYRVVVYLTGAAGTCHLWYLYGQYTAQGDYNFVTPSPIVNGALSYPFQFNRWRTNDIYFRQTMPRQHAFSGIRRSYTGNDTGAPLWDTWVKHRHRGVYYRIYISTNASSNKVTLYYDYGGANETSLELTANNAWLEDTWTMDASDIPVGTRVRFYAEMTCSAHTAAAAEIAYLRIGPHSGSTPGSPWVQMGEFTPGQWVHGDTTGYTTALQNLSHADDFIFPRLNWNATVGRMDYAVATPTWNGHPIGTVGHFAMQRRYDTLYYRTTAARLEWGTGETFSLEDYDDTDYTTRVDYKTLDLNNLDNLAHGQTYYIRADVDDGELMFAQERP